MATFSVSDFFDVPISAHKNGAKFIDISALKTESKTESDLAKILSLRGVYVFSIRAGKGRRPWYVGKSEKSTFLKEAFNERNQNGLNAHINNHKGTLQINFITQERTPGKPNLKQIAEIEYLLIGYAANRNPNLLNKNNKNQDYEFVIKNVYNSGSGKPSNREREFKSLMGL